MKKGDIILIPFPFTDLSSIKTRPALVLHASQHDVTVAFITSKLIQKDAYDVELVPDSMNRLKVDSIVKLNKIATLDNALRIGRIGQVSTKDLSIINLGLRKIFAL